MTEKQNLFLYIPQKDLKSSAKLSLQSFRFQHSLDGPYGELKSNMQFILNLN